MPAPAPPSLPVAVLYPRQSKTDAEERADGESLSSRNQIARGEAYSIAYGLSFDRELSEACTDLDLSGGAKEKDRRRGVRSWQKRPGLWRLYEAAKEGRFQHLLVYDLNRLGGDATELHLIREAFADLGVIIHVIKEGIRTDTESGRLTFTIFTAFSEKRLKDISTTARDVAASRIKDARQAVAIGTGAGKQHGRPPHWIRIKPSAAQTAEELAIEVRDRGPRGTIGWYELNDFADTMREMVRRRMTGLSNTVIARTLNEDGYRTAKGRLWDAQQVCEYLNPEYRLKFRGCAIYHLRKPGDGRRDGELLVTPGVFPPLLTEADADALDATQYALQQRSFHPLLHQRQPGDLAPVQGILTPSPATVRARTSFLCSGIAHCALCGARLISTTSGKDARRDKNYLNYGCKAARYNTIPHPNKHRKDTDSSNGSGGSSNGSGSSGAGMFIGQERLDRAVFNAMTLLARHLKQTGWKPAPQTQQQQRTAKKEAGQAGKRGKAARRTAEEISEAIDRLLELVEAGRLSGEDYDRRYRALSEERDAILAHERQESDARSQESGLRALTEMFADTASAPVWTTDTRPDETQTASLRLVLLQIAARVEAPLVRPDALTRGARGDAYIEHIRLQLKEPLPDGTLSVLSAMHKHNFDGPRRVLLENAEEQRLAFPTPAGM